MNRYRSHKKTIYTDTLFINIVFTILLLLHSSCKKFVEVNSPNTNITGKNVFTDASTATAVLTGIYTNMSSSSLTSGDLISIGFLSGLTSDELSLQANSNADLNSYYLNNLNGNGYTNIWSNNYPKLFPINSVIEKVPSSESLTSDVKRQLVGEAKFMRAFVLFYLVNLYGDVPLVVSTDYTKNSTLSRAPSTLVWSQIITDLKDAVELLSTNYLDPTLLNSTTERIRPTKWAAMALLARSYLYTHEWKNAETQSTNLINNTSLFHIDSLDNVFLKNNPEAIWQLQPVNFGSNTEDAKIYFIHSQGFTPSKPVYLSPNLMNSFETNDQRKNKWTNSISLNGETYHFASKYKSDSLNLPVTEYNTVFRISEQYLIRAEARANQSNIQGSLDDLNIIRERAWLKKYQTNVKNDLLSEIYHERQVELFTEWGHRWLDLKRTQMINTVMSVVTPQKGGTWSPNWQLYPIPPSDIIYDNNLIQNEGY